MQERVRRSAAIIDVIVYALIAGVGILAVAMPRHSADFFTGDTTYFELARSLVETGSYGFNFHRETLLPPGLPAILALLCLTVGSTYMVLLRSIAIFAALGLIAAYQLLRREQGRPVAALACLLLASSPILFRLATRVVLSDLPYLFTSLVALLALVRLDRARGRGSRVALGLLAAFMLVASLMIRSAGVALLAGLAAWLVVSGVVHRDAARRRLTTFLPVLVVGLLVQGLWMHREAGGEVLDWPMVGGYPHSYLAQLTVKNGNRPELGLATLRDVPVRIVRNLNERAVWLARVLIRKDYIHAAWFSPLVLGPCLLISLGVARSMAAGGGSIVAWYFAAHEAMYLPWPWDFEERFVLPVAPLACLYLWRGGAALRDLVSARPRASVVAGIVISVPLGAWAGVAAVSTGSLQALAATIFWGGLTALSAWTLWRQAGHGAALARLGGRLAVVLASRGSWPSAVPMLTAALVACLVVAGVAEEVQAGRDNRRFDLARQPSYGDVKAGEWIRAHLDADAIVMARQLDVVYHYGRRRVVWFPPISDPGALMMGIRSHRVDFVVVVRRPWTYWVPAEAECFARLASAVPGAFQPVHEDDRFTIFRVEPGDARVSAAPR